ncbi:small ribosomal subunit protein mS40-like [Babylonia areolata]|uniref:small ribosomal subunit protein mS40-like n=1 Tax=Babylonia areolata TaxID=304850 RepID=UPI003FD3AC32
MAASRATWLSANILSKFLGRSQVGFRGFTTTVVHRQCSAAGDGEEEENLSKPQRLVVDPDTSIRYMESQAYSEAYGDKPVWFYYRRNFKGQHAPETRKTCIRKGEIATGSPCPVCRDEYLVLDYKNIKLLEQFISPYTGDVLETKKTGICQKQHRKLLVEVMKAKDLGYLEKNIPFRVYDYSQYWDEASGKVL